MWSMIVSRQENDTKQDWYFSFNTGTRSLYLSGYREYRPGAGGAWGISKRYYPKHTGLMENMIPLSEVPLPDEVRSEAIAKYVADIGCHKG